MGEQSYHLRRYHARRKEAVAKLGGACVECGSQDNLEIDHIDPATKEIELGSMWSVAKHRYDAELEKCQLLCSRHHKQKSDREQTHRVCGTYSMYRKGKCRCEPCKEANRAYSRMIYAQKKRASAV